MKIYCNGSIIADNVKIADNFFTRFKGLMGKKSLNLNDGLLLKNCSSIHCFFMKITILAVYLSKDMTVLGFETLKPWSIGKTIKRTAHVLELNAGLVSLTVGDVLEIHNN